MENGMRVGWMIAAGAACLALACANGATTPVLLDDGAGDDAGTSSYLPPSGGEDSGARKPPGQVIPTPDAPAPVDGGKEASLDSGPPTAPPAGDDCVGTTSAQLSSSYDDACDAYWFNTFGKSNPCTPGSTSCGSHDTSTLKFCCFTPPSGSFCADDYSTSQCIPK